jgi:hypothetical protein
MAEIETIDTRNREENSLYYKFSFFPSIPLHQFCHIPKTLSSLGPKREKEKGYGFWEDSVASSNTTGP